MKTIARDSCEIYAEMAVSDASLMLQAVEAQEAKALKVAREPFDPLGLIVR